MLSTVTGDIVFLSFFLGGGGGLATRDGEPTPAPTTVLCYYSTNMFYIYYADICKYVWEAR